MSTQVYKNKCKDYSRRYRLTCITFYGGVNPKCACCGESIYEFLSIDHINGGGNKHRKEMRSGQTKSSFGGATTYRWLINNKFPEGFQVLCHNCNLAKGYYGKCPHELKSVTN